MHITEIEQLERSRIPYEYVEAHLSRYLVYDKDGTLLSTTNINGTRGVGLAARKRVWEWAEQGHTVKTEAGQ